MEPLHFHSGLVAPLDRADVDTDQIIPKQFLKRIERTGYGDFLFYDWRVTPNGEPQPDFVLNQPQYRDASILVAGKNFGCGSSREHAAWALHDFGFRVVIAPSFADIFASNAVNNGMAPVVLTAEAVEELLRRAQQRPGYRLTVDIAAGTISDDAGLALTFALDPFRRRRLLEGLDDIGLTLKQETAIAAYEQRRPAFKAHVERGRPTNAANSPSLSS